MNIKQLELKSKSKNRNSYHVICGDIIIGSITNFSGDDWIIDSKLPNTNNIVVKKSKDDAISYLTNKLQEFINSVTNL